MTMLTTKAELLIDMIEAGAPFSDDAFLSVQRGLADHITKNGGTREIGLAYRLADARLQSFRRSVAHEAYVRAGCTHEAWVAYCKAMNIDISPDEPA